MTLASWYRCFLLVVTVINLIIYIYMFGNLGIFKIYAVREQNSYKALQAGDTMQNRMSKLVGEAIRDQRIIGNNLTEMLVKAMEQYEVPQDAVLDPGRIRYGKSGTMNHTEVATKSDISESDALQKADMKEVGEPVPIQHLQIEIGDIKRKEQLAKQGDGNANPGQDIAPNEDVLDRTGNNDSGKPVVLPHDYNLVISEPNKCKNDDGSDKPIFLLVLINSVDNHLDRRNAIRMSWGSPEEIDGKQVVTMFLLANTSNPSHQKLLEQESKQYHDLIMEDFTDSYKNLTLKTIMAMKWASIFCPQAAFVMKTDDDMYVGYANIVKHISMPATPTKSYVTGNVMMSGPVRDPSSKWYVPRETYPEERYPPFCTGSGYVMSGDMPRRIYETSLHTPFIYLEDVYVAICLDSLKVVPVKHMEFKNVRIAYSYCRFKRIFTTHMVTPTEMNEIWNDQKIEKGYNCDI